MRTGAVHTGRTRAVTRTADRTLSVRQADGTTVQQTYAAGSTEDFPVGEHLINAMIRSGWNTQTTPESLAVSRYIESRGLELREVIGAFLDGESLNAQTVERLVTDSGLRPLFGPVVEAGMRLGMNRVEALWADLIAREVRIPGTTYEYFEFDNGSTAGGGPGTEEFGLKRVGQGAPIPTARINVSGRTIRLLKFGRGIEWTREATRAPVDLAAMWFSQLGLQIGWDYHDQVVDVLLNGYFDDNSDDAPVVSAATPGTITDVDLYVAQLKHQTTFGYTPQVMLASQTRAVAIRTLENGAGQRIFPDGLQAAGLPELRVSDSVPSDKVIFVDTDYALLRLVNQDFGVEDDYDPKTQIGGSYGTSSDVTVVLFPEARLILDA